MIDRSYSASCSKGAGRERPKGKSPEGQDLHPAQAPRPLQDFRPPRKPPFTFPPRRPNCLSFGPNHGKSPFPFSPAASGPGLAPPPLTPVGGASLIPCFLWQIELVHQRECLAPRLWTTAAAAEEERELVRMRRKSCSCFFCTSASTPGVWRKPEGGSWRLIFT